MVNPFASAWSVKQNPEAAPKPGTRNPGGPQFAPLAQIRAANVHTLEPRVDLPHTRRLRTLVTCTASPFLMLRAVSHELERGLCVTPADDSHVLALQIGRGDRELFEFLADPQRKRANIRDGVLASCLKRNGQNAIVADAL